MHGWIVTCSVTAVVITTLAFPWTYATRLLAHVLIREVRTFILGIHTWTCK